GSYGDWSSDVCSSDLTSPARTRRGRALRRRGTGSFFGPSGTGGRASSPPLPPLSRSERPVILSAAGAKDPLLVCANRSFASRAFRALAQDDTPRGRGIREKKKDPLPTAAGTRPSC